METEEIIGYTSLIVLAIICFAFFGFIMYSVRESRNLQEQNEKIAVETFGDFKAAEIRNPYRDEYRNWFRTNGYELASITPNKDSTNEVYMIFRKTEMKDAK